MAKFTSVADYIDNLPVPHQEVAMNLRRIILEAAPEAIEAIRYDMPAFQIGDKAFLYFACWKNHVGLYPIHRGDARFEASIAPFRAAKDTVQLPYRVSLPEKLVVRIVNSELARLRRSARARPSRS